ncbi:MAG: TolC family protein [Phycisphaerales bacterium]
MPRPLTVGVAPVSIAIFLLTSCSAPLRPRDAADDGKGLGPAVTSALERELAQLPTTAAPLPPPAASTDVEQTLISRRTELEAIGPQWTQGGTGLDVGPGLDVAAPTEVQLGLKTAIQKAVQNNLAVQAARVTQAISDAQLAQAEAAFDATLFADTNFTRSTQPGIGTVVGGGVLINSLRNNREWAFTTGIQKPLVTGGRVEVSTSMSRNTIFPTSAYSPDPAWSTAVNLGLVQPLLRGFGTDVNMAQIRVARNTDRIAYEQMRSQLLQTVANAEAAYWRLALARQRLVAAKWLVEVGTESRDVLARRREFDATLAQYANAVATVEQRKASVIEAQRAVQLANNTLKAVMNDPDLPVGGEASIVPMDLPVDAPVQQDLRQAIISAAEKSPEVAAALLNIDSTSIGVTVADNQRLPQLDLEGRLGWFGLDGDFGQAYSDITSGDFVEYVVGARFSQAIGNQAAEAGYREARLSRSKAVLAYRASVQSAVLQVKNALQDVRTNYDLIRQNRAFRLAQAENLRALLVSEKTLAALTPEFLQLKFQLQDTLARAQLQWVGSLTEYNVAMSELYRAMGTGLDMNQIEIKVIDPKTEGTLASK